MTTSEPVVDLAGVENVPAGQEGRLRDAFALLKANKLALVGLVLTILFLLVGIVGAVILLTPSLHHLWEEQRLAEALQPPSSSHLLGTDQYGRDLMWRTIGGVGIAVLIGVGVTAVVIVIGLAFGSIAGYYGGRRDTAISGLIDLTWALPAPPRCRDRRGHDRQGAQGSRHRRRGHPLGRLRADHSRAGQNAVRARVRRGGADARGSRVADPDAAHGPERDGNRARDGLVLRRLDRDRRGRLLVHQPRRPAADPEPRRDGRGGPQLLDGVVLAGGRFPDA